MGLVRNVIVYIIIMLIQHIQENLPSVTRPFPMFCKTTNHTHHHEQDVTTAMVALAFFVVGKMERPYVSLSPIYWH